MSFLNLGLSDCLVRAIADMGYDTPTPVQQKAIPVVFMNRDILACAQTGTGKTASFALPIMDILNGTPKKSRMPKAVVIEPTRELALQVQENFEKYSKYIPFSTAIVIGGSSMQQQQKAIAKGVDVVIATPGRLLDLIEQGNILLTEVKICVIDEADRMLDMGFIPDIEKLTKMLPPLRQNIMFSATYPNNIKKLAQKFLNNPKEIIVSPSASTAENIEQWLVSVSHYKQKFTRLIQLIDNEPIKNAIIFCNRKRDVDEVYDKLLKQGINAGALHGDMVQSQRIECLDRFKNDEITYLVCSDVAARGLDIPEVSHVINMDVPTSSEDYVHRIGRTGRAGKTGVSFTMVAPKDDKAWGGILKLIKKQVKPYALESPLEKPKTKSKKPRAKTPPPPKRPNTDAIYAEESKKPFGEQVFVPAFLTNGNA